MTTNRHPANLPRGSGDGGKHKAALARLHSARSLNRSQGFTAEGGGSSLTPLGWRSFIDERQDELAFLNEEEGDDLPDGEWECQFPGNCLHPSVDHHESECYTQEMAEDFLKARALGISIDDPPDPA